MPMPKFSQTPTKSQECSFWRQDSEGSNSSHAFPSYNLPASSSDVEGDVSELVASIANTYDEDDVNMVPPYHHHVETEQEAFKAALANYIDAVGVSAVVADILESSDIKSEVLKTVLSESHTSLKESLKGSKSILTSSKKDRTYLLSLTPKKLCEEFQENSDPSFQLLLNGLLGISDPAIIFESQYLLNTVALVYSTVAKVINRNATGYALLLTTSARDGGLREDSLGMFSCMVHVRTSQKYDKETLANGWDQGLKARRKRSLSTTKSS